MMALGGGNGQLCVPPGFRFHPTDEELLYYYLRKKVSYEAIDLDVIREVDLNKLEPWDLKDKCRIGSGPQNEWYFFSHKDKKYPTGTRTNRATTAGFWKATGRDKAIHHSNSNSSKRIGMRKTLVFYTGRAPHGQKTDWIMHEYRLDGDGDSGDNDAAAQVQEDGWVICRVFMKKSHSRGEFGGDQDILKPSSGLLLDQEAKQGLYSEPTNFDDGSSMHLPQLLSPISSSFNTASGCGGVMMQQQERFNGGSCDWSFLDRLLLANGQDQINKYCHPYPWTSDVVGLGLGPSASASAAAQRFPFQY